MLRTISGEPDAGPTVATSFVQRRMALAALILATTTAFCS